MKLSHRTLLAAVIALSLFFAGQVPGSAFSMDFSQISWMDNSGGYTAQYSSWGSVGVTFDASDIGSFTSDGGGGYYGWVNIEASIPGGASNSWIVQNRAMHFDNSLSFDNRIADEMEFDLGNSSPGMLSGSVQYAVTISNFAYGLAPGAALGGTSNLNQDNFLWGGEDDEAGNASNTGSAAPGAAKNFKSGVGGDKIGASASANIKDTDVAKIDEQVNGCAPAAAARSLNYLKQSGNIGGALDPAQTIYNTLKGPTYMATSLGDTGSGTKISNFIAGKNKYSTDKVPGLTTQVTTTFYDAIQGLKDGKDIEIGLTNPDGNGGHCAMVVGIREIKDSNGVTKGYEVDVIDDPTQGDGTAANRKHTYTFGADGKLGTKGKLNSFRMEKVVPEPGSIVALAAGVLGFAGMFRKKSVG